jgi:hypothetical protein
VVQAQAVGLGAVAAARAPAVEGDAPLLVGHGRASREPYAAAPPGLVALADRARLQRPGLDVRDAHARVAVPGACAVADLSDGEVHVSAAHRSVHLRRQQACSELTHAEHRCSVPAAPSPMAVTSTRVSLLVRAQ